MEKGLNAANDEPFANNYYLRTFGYQETDSASLKNVSKLP